MKISIVTPNYNYDKYIGQTIESVINQNYLNYELIIVDDGSTDNSVNVIQQFVSKYPNQIILIRQKNQGQTKAINVGLKSATGDLIGWINSDDCYCDNAFSKIVKVFSENPEIDAVFGDIIIIDEANRFIKKNLYLPFDYKSGVFNGFGKIVSSNAIFWRSKLLEETGLLDESFKYAMDSEYWSRLLYKKKVKHINENIAKFRWHDRAKTIIRRNTNSISNLEAKNEDLKVFYSSYRNLAISKYFSVKYSIILIIIFKLKRYTMKLAKRHYFSL